MPSSDNRFRTAFLIPALVLLLQLAGGCVVYKDKDTAADTSVSVNDIIFHKCVTPLYRAIELSDFFTRYQEISGDEDAVGELGYSYFAEGFSSDDLSEESASVNYWGSIAATGEEGKYTVTISRFWAGVEVIFDVTDLKDGSFVVDYDPANNLLTSDSGYEADITVIVNVDDDAIVVDDLNIVYTETTTGEELEVHVVAGTDDETVKMNICTKGTYYAYPFEGVLYYTVSGYVSMNFKVVFSDTSFDVISDDGQDVVTIFSATN